MGTGVDPITITTSAYIFLVIVVFGEGVINLAIGQFEATDRLAIWQSDAPNCLIAYPLARWYVTIGSRSSGLVSKECDDVGALLLLLDACKDHLGAGHVLLRVDEVLPEMLLRPHNPGVLVGTRVPEAVH